MVKFSDLLGQTLVSVDLVQDKYGDSIHFVTSTGTRYKLYHEQDCCENVNIEDIAGELAWLLQTPILMAEEVSSEKDGEYDHTTWTFYKLATIRGYVTIRWYGSSNGYYSESVRFVEEK